MNTLSADLNIIAEAYENILRNKMSYGTRVQARRIYVEKLERLASRTPNTEAQELIESAISNVQGAESPALVRRASELV